MTAPVSVHADVPLNRNHLPGRQAPALMGTHRWGSSRTISRQQHHHRHHFDMPEPGIVDPL